MSFIFLLNKILYINTLLVRLLKIFAKSFDPDLALSNCSDGIPEVFLVI